MYVRLAWGAHPSCICICVLKTAYALSPQEGSLDAFVRVHISTTVARSLRRSGPRHLMTLPFKSPVAKNLLTAPDSHSTWSSGLIAPSSHCFYCRGSLSQFHDAWQASMRPRRLCAGDFDNGSEALALTAGEGGRRSYLC